MSYDARAMLHEAGYLPEPPKTQGHGDHLHDVRCTECGGKAAFGATVCMACVAVEKEPA